MPARDNMITPSLESTSCLNAGIVEPVPLSVLNRGNAPLLPFVSAFSGKQPRGSIFDRLVPVLPPMHCQLQCIPWLGLVLFQIGWWTPLFRQQSLLVISSHIVGHSSKFCWKNNVNSLLRAKLGEQVSLVIRLLYLAAGIFPFFNACWTKLVMRTNICCATFSAFLSLVLRLCVWRIVTQICLVPVQHYQDDHHCVEPSYSVAQAWTLIKHFYGLLGPKLATPGGDKFPFPSPVYRLLGTKVDLTVSPREIQVLPSRVDSICCELKQILASKNLSKGYAS